MGELTLKWGWGWGGVLEDLRAAAGASKAKYQADIGSTTAGVRKHVCSAGTQKKPHGGGEEKHAFRGGACTERPGGREGEEMELPYLHGLDGLVGIVHGAELVVHGLLRQQQLVEDLQRPGPVANRFQRHDRTTSWPCGTLPRGGPDTLSPAHTLLHALDLPLSDALERPRPGCR